MSESSPIEEALRTLVLTDVVGSTAWIEAAGDRRAAEVFALADRAARDLLRTHDGLEIDHTDGFLLLFDHPAAAVRYAVDLHAALGSVSEGLERALGMRVGIHVGTVVMRRIRPEDVERGAKPIEVEGLAKPFTARLMSLADAGQTLLSQAAWDLVQRSKVGDPTLEPSRGRPMDRGWSRA